MLLLVARCIRKNRPVKLEEPLHHEVTQSFFLCVVVQLLPERRQLYEGQERVVPLVSLAPKEGALAYVSLQ